MSSKSPSAISESDKSFRNQVDKYKKVLLAKIPDQLDMRREQLISQGKTDGPEFTAVTELLAGEKDRNRPFKIADDTRKNIRNWETDWQKHLNKK